jgi:hypothetical protein
VNGDGFVVTQRPAAGSALDDIDEATLVARSPLAS